MWLLRTLPNNVLGHIGIKYSFKGTNACITNHSVGGLLAVIEAIEALRAGEADRVVAVGHETPIEPQMVLYYHRRRPARDRHAAAVRRHARWQPVRRRRGRAGARDGGVGGGRGAAVLGEVLGSGYASEGQGLLAIRADGDGLRRAIAQALDDAGIAAADVGMIVAHGNGTQHPTRRRPRRSGRVFGPSGRR